MPQPVYILASWLITGLVSLLLGRMLLRRLGVTLHREEENGLGFLLGSAVLSLIVFALMAAHVAYKPVFLLVWSAVITAGWKTGAFRARGDRLPALPPLARGLFLAGYAVYTYLYFWHAMAPETSPDGASYHLSLVARYLRERGFPWITTNMYANLSQAIELLFVNAFVFGKHSAAAMVHFWFTLMLPWLMVRYGQRIARPWAGVCAALLVYASPIIGKDGTSAYIDVAVAAIAFGLFYALEVWTGTRERGLLCVAGILAGFAFGAKYTAGVAIPYALAFVAWKCRSWRPLVPVALGAALLAGPWLVKNTIVVANPVSPFFNSLFPNPYIHLKFEKEYRQLMAKYGIEDRRELPLEVTVRGAKVTGFLGAVFVLAPLGLLALARPEGRRLWLAAVLFGAAFATNTGTRFLIPALPFVSLAMSLVFARWQWLAVLVMAAHAYTSWPSNVRRYCDPYAWRLAGIPWKAALRIETERDYLWNHSLYRVVQMVERKVPPGQTVFTPNGIWEAYTSRNVMVGYQGALNETVMDFLYTGYTYAFQPRRVWDFRFPQTRVRRIRIYQTGQGVFPEMWSVSEIRFYLGEQELPRLPEWRLRAHPNPWDVQLAFDNNPGTRWRGWDTLRPGDHFEIDFGAERQLDRVRLEMSEDQVNTALRVELWRDGRWELATDEYRESAAEPPYWLRLALMKEVKARGVDYLLIHQADFGAQEFAEDPEGWGLELVEVVDGVSLYKIVTEPWPWP